jgi:hypothetical protein
MRRSADASVVQDTARMHKPLLSSSGTRHSFSRARTASSRHRRPMAPAAACSACTGSSGSSGSSHQPSIALVCASFGLCARRRPPSENAVRYLLRCDTTGSDLVGAGALSEDTTVPTGDGGASTPSSGLASADEDVCEREQRREARAVRVCVDGRRRRVRGDVEDEHALERGSQGLVDARLASVWRERDRVEDPRPSQYRSIASRARRTHRGTRHASFPANTQCAPSRILGACAAPRSLRRPNRDVG